MPRLGRCRNPSGPAPFPETKSRYIAQQHVQPESHATRLAPVTHFPFSMSDKTDGTGSDAGILTKTKTRTQRPPMYKVMLLNDDYTPMEFVVHVLERFFGLTHAQAFDIMLTVHKKGLAVVGVFSFEVAETKVAQVMDFARRHQHPLQCTMEKE
jgi:ATP-dependent Clp protease adaptor protein ClpS